MSKYPYNRIITSQLFVDVFSAAPPHCYNKRMRVIDDWVLVTFHTLDDDDDDDDGPLQIGARACNVNSLAARHTS